MRCVLDTNIVASSLLWNGAPRRLLDVARTGDVQLVTSEPLIAELQNILSRSKFKKRIQDSQHSVEKQIALYSKLAVLIVPFAIPRIASDPDVVIGTALAAKADFIVTGDKALLTVGEYGGVRIVSVHEALRAAALDLPPA